MYMDILLALALAVCGFLLWRRISQKIPELEIIPDQDLSVLLEENTAKIQRFFLHLFHFRSFYRERHYHEKVRAFGVKFLFRLHVFVLRMDNSIVRLMRRMREPGENAVDQEKEKNDPNRIILKLQNRMQEEQREVPVLPVAVPVMAAAPVRTNRIQEVRPVRARKRPERAIKDRRIPTTVLSGTERRKKIRIGFAESQMAPREAVPVKGE